MPEPTFEQRMYVYAHWFGPEALATIMGPFIGTSPDPQDQADSDRLTAEAYAAISPERHAALSAEISPLLTKFAIAKAALGRRHA